MAEASAGADGRGPGVGEIRALRRRMERLEERIRSRRSIRVELEHDVAYLGEDVEVLATVLDGTGRPVADATVLASTTRGRLSAGGSSDDRAGALTARSDEDGRVRLTLGPEPEERLTDPQRRALAAALVSMPRGDVSPAEAEGRLREILRRYASPGGAHLREAVDILFASFGSSLLEARNPRNRMAGWRSTGVAVELRTSAGEDEPAPASSAVVLELRDWLGPWLQLFRREAGRKARVEEDLRGAAGTGDGSVHETVRRFVEGLPGLAGRRVGRKVVSDTVSLMAGRAADEPTSEGLSELIRFYGAGDPADPSPEAPEAVERIRSVARRESSRVGEKAERAVGELQGRLAEVNSSLEGKAPRAAVVSLQEELGRKVDTGALSGLEERVAGKADAEALASVRNGLEAKADAETLRSVRDTLEAKADLEALESVRGSLDAKADVGAVRRLRNQVARKVSQQDFTRRVGGLESRIRELPSRNQITRQIQDLRSTMEQRVGNLPDARRMQDLTQRLANLEQKNRAVSTKVNRINRAGNFNVNLPDHLLDTDINLP